MSVCYIALGSNLNSPLQQLNTAKNAIDKISATQVTHCSSIYQSKALTLDDEPQQDYLNAVIEVATSLPAESLLDELQAIENCQGRLREKRWAARTIDLDLILYAEQHIKSERLTVPHGEMVNRNFVLYPLYEIAPELIIPGGKSLKEMLSTISDQCLIKVGEFDG